MRRLFNLPAQDKFQINEISIDVGDTDIPLTPDERRIQ